MNTKTESALQFFESMLKAMALRPNDLYVIPMESIGAVDVVIRCNAADTARLIGKRGAMAESIRSIGHAVFGRINTQFRLDDIVDDGNAREEFTDFVNQQDWDYKPTKQLLESLLRAMGWDFDLIDVTEHNQWTYKLWVTVTPETARRMSDEIVSAINAIFIVIGTRSGKKVFVRFRERGRRDPIGGRGLGIPRPVCQSTRHMAPR